MSHNATLIKTLTQDLIKARLSAVNDLANKFERLERSTFHPISRFFTNNHRKPAEQRQITIKSAFRKYILDNLIGPWICDINWYLRTNPDVAAAEQDPWHHFIKYGIDEYRSPNPFFDAGWYSREYKDVAESGENPILHYLFFGALEHRNPSLSFDAVSYVRLYPEAVVNPLRHYLENRYQPLLSSGLPVVDEERIRLIFDSQWYINNNPDVAGSGLDGWAHFIIHGLRENRAPSRQFDSEKYAAKFIKPKDEIQVSLLHYIRHNEISSGAPDYGNLSESLESHQLRTRQSIWLPDLGTDSPSLLNSHRNDQAASVNHGDRIRRTFDNDWYLEKYPDVAESGIDAFQHYLEHGMYEGRAPNAFFDPAWYTLTYPDIIDANVSPYLHYVMHGAAEGRDPSGSFDTSWYVDSYPEAAADPFSYHIEVGQFKNLPTCPEIDVAEFLPSDNERILASGVVVDIIIPVYRGLEETQRCLESVVGDYSAKLGDVIVINDCSPEPELVAYLQSLAAEHKIKLIENHENLGFVASVNLGMNVSKPNDVVLLNSDTIVPNNWLHRLLANAYASPRIGTVAPFSNNATICSYPSLPGGPMPSRWTLQEIDEACDRANIGRQVDLPTSVGFAMFIKRECLEDVGLFDVKTFGLGYGEENDFSLRATGRGWKHVLACDTFVFHQGEVSFGVNSPKKDTAWKILTERYPNYASLVSKHIRRDAAAPYRFAATAQLILSSRKPIILIVTHGLGGGTERHINDMIASMDETFEFVFMRPFGVGVSIEFSSMKGLSPLVLNQNNSDDLLAVISSLRISRVHVHHIFHFHLNLRSVIRSLGIPFDFTVHDYFSICPQINLISSVDRVYCGEPNASGCGNCISVRTTVPGVSDIVSWRCEHQWLYTEADRVICPSNDVRQRMVNYGAKNTIVIPHEEVTSADWDIKLPELLKDEPTRIAILGVLAPHKGAAAVLNCASNVDARNIEFVLIGRAETGVEIPPTATFRQTGSYVEDELDSLILEVNPHAIWFPAPWPETYSYTLSAAIRSGLPIIATNIGAFPERLSGHPWKWLLPFDTTTDDWLDVFDHVRHAIVTKSPPSPITRRPLSVRSYESDYFVSTKHSADDHGSKLIDLREKDSISILVVPERLADGSISPCGFIRVVLPLRRLSVEFQKIKLTFARSEECINYVSDLVVLNRFSPEGHINPYNLIEHFRSNRIGIVYDLDDNLLEINAEHPEAEELVKRSEIIRIFVKESNVIMVSTDNLKRYVSKYNENVVCLENALDDDFLPKGMSSNARNLSSLRAVYMGTSTHEADFELIRPALDKLYLEFGTHLSIDLIGVTRTSILPLNVKRYSVPLAAQRSYPAFLHWISRERVWQLGLSPLTHTVFNASKSPIKALDYMATGAVPIVSNVPAYSSLSKSSVVHVENSSDAWFQSIGEFVEDRLALEKFLENASREFERTWTLSAHRSKRMAAWDSVFSRLNLKDL